MLHCCLSHKFIFSNFCRVSGAFPRNTRCTYTWGQFVLANLSTGKFLEGWWNSHAESKGTCTETPRRQQPEHKLEPRAVKQECFPTEKPPSAKSTVLKTFLFFPQGNTHPLVAYCFIFMRCILQSFAFTPLMAMLEYYVLQIEHGIDVVRSV